MEFPEEHSPNTICIIGTGPSGLAALKTVLDTPQFKRGAWSVEAYEPRERVGGIWNPSPANREEKEPPLTPLYDSLTTNLPHPVMGFTSYIFPPGTPLFPKAEYVQRYLEEYARHFGLECYIRLRTAVKLVERDSLKGDKWQVTLDNGETRSFDFVIVSNGHYRVPRYPDVKGLEAWREDGRAWHSVWYRRPEDVLKEKVIKKVLVIGAGPSGLDISAELAASGGVGEVVHSVSGTRQVERIARNVRRRGRVLEFRNWKSGEVLFDDEGEVEQGVDCCILATGYEMSFPFLPQDILRLQVPPPIPPVPRDLYNNTYSVVPLAKHIFPLGSNSLAFVGLPIRVAPFPLVEAQARMIVHVFAHPEALDSTREAIDIASRYEDLGGSYKKWHVFQDMEQFAYRDELYRLSDVAGTGKEGIEGRVVVADWEKEMYLKKAILRRFWVDLEEKGLADDWVRGVGEGGLEEWVQLMKRILREAEKEGIEPDDRAKV